MGQKPVDALKAEHDQLKAEIEAAYGRDTRDEAHIGELKRRKLRLKDQIAQLEHARTEHAH